MDVVVGTVRTAVAGLLARGPKHVAAWLVGGAVSSFLIVDWLRHRRAPGPTRVPFFGNVLWNLWHFHCLHPKVVAMLRAQKSTYIVQRIFFDSLILVTDPRDVEHILKTNWKNYLVSVGTRADAGKEIFGTGIFRADGAHWFVQRKAATKEFSARRFRDFMSGVFLQESKKLVDILLTQHTDGKPVEMQSYFMKLTLDGFCRIAFDLPVGALDGKPIPFAKAFDDAQAQVARRMLNYPPRIWQVARYFPIYGHEKENKKNIAIIDEFLYGIVQQRIDSLASPKHRSSAEPVADDLLARVAIAAADEQGVDRLDRVQIRDLLVNFIIAGRDTTGCALSWTLYEMCRHPNVLALLLEEVHTATGGNDPNYDNVNSCVYLEAVLLEVLRLHPSVPIDPKTVKDDDQLPGSGVKVHAGDTVAYSSWAMGRMEAIWGSDADEFKPDRWIKSDGKVRKASPFEYPVFQAGPRVCLGQEMAMLELKLVVTYVFQRLQFELQPEPPVMVQTTVTNQMKHGIHVKVSPRASSS